jgi:hypothetical protein
MQSDILPFTAYDSMSYESVQTMPPPSGFMRREDAPMVQSRNDGPPPMAPVPNVGGVLTSQPTKPVKQKLNYRGEVEDGGGASSSQGTDLDLGEEPVKPKGADISNYRIVSDFTYIFLAVLAVDVIVIFLVRYYPDFFGTTINRWYDLFGLNAVIADVVIIVIGFAIARYVYTLYVKRKFAAGKWSPAIFTGTLVGTQLLHDLAFYYGIITQIPRGHNLMMDVFKDYAASGGVKVLAADAAMMVGSSILSIVLKGAAPHLTAAFGLLTLYALPYILYTKPQT